MQWTKEQKLVIDGLRNKNLLVSAAAGAGKTTVLVERIISLLLEEKVDIDQMLIVTFTRAAAAEMKEKIQQVLEERLAELEKAPHIREQLDRLNRAQICTNHAFALEIVKRHIHLLDIDPAFRVGESTETDILQDEALKEVMEDYYRQGSDSFHKLVESYSSGRGDDKLRQIILDVYHFIQSKPYPFQWLAEAVEMFSPEENNYQRTPWMVELRDKIGDILSSGEEQLKRALDICNREKGPHEYSENIEDELEDLRDLQQQLETGMESFYSRLLSIRFSRLKSIRGQRKDEVNDRLKEEVKRLRDLYKEDIRDLKESAAPDQLSRYYSQLRELFPLMEKLKEIVADFSRYYNLLKQDRNILDFNDIEHYALEVLENKEAVDKLREKYKYIFVDEYQDSNQLQETIINRIKRENNLFLVGDVKQSIYRFRLAEPTLFLEKYRQYSTELYHREVRVDLGQNFRSRREILQGVNFLFRNLMSHKLGEIKYGKKAALVPGLKFQRKPDENPVELNLLENNCKEIEDENIENLGRTEMEARFAAERIKKLLGKTIQDPRNDEIRPLDYRDIVILLRSPAGRIETYQEVFLEENIPLYTDLDFGFLETVEIKVFINLLKVLDNQKQDLPLLSVMRSTIGGFSVAELARIRTAFKEGDFQDAIRNYAQEKENGLASKINIFQQKLREWRGEARYLQMDEFIWKLLMDTGYYHFAGSLPGGERRQANLRVLVERAREFERTAGAGIFNYLRFIDKLAESSGDIGTARVIGENENVVRLMSVHKSKGLEFPVVLLGDLGKRFNFNDLKKPILLHRELGIGPRYVDVEKRVYSHSLPRLAIKERKKREDLSEELRILYVAMTRAINRLILYGSANNFSTKSRRWLRGLKPYYLLKGKSYLDWIGSVLVHHSQGFKLRQLAGVGDDEIEILTDNSCWEINYYDLHVLGQKAEEEVFDQNILKEKLLSFPQSKETSYGEEIDRRLNWQYSHREAVHLPSKMSVTDIQKAGAGFRKNTVYNIPPMAAEPKFAKEESGFTAAEKGSIMHFVMQHLDLKATGEEDIKRQLKTMKEQKLLDPEELEVVDVTKIVNFFTCKPGRKMLAAEEVYREIPFVLKKKASEIFAGLETEEEILVQGIIDCYFKKGGQLILLDYKTDRIISGQKGIRQKYSEQLAIYREALEKITEQRVTESYIYLFSRGKAIKMD